MDPNLYFAALVAAGVVVSGGITIWAGNRLLRFGAGAGGRDAAGKPSKTGRTPAP